MSLLKKINYVSFLDKVGQLAIVSTERPMKMRKKSDRTFYKRATFATHIGQNYNELESVQDARENGTAPAEPQPLPWGKWLVENLIIVHTPKATKDNPAPSEKEYLRCTVPQSKMPSSASFYEMIGNVEVAVSMDDVIVECLGSEVPKPNAPEKVVFNIDIETITSFE